MHFLNSHLTRWPSQPEHLLRLWLACEHVHHTSPSSALACAHRGNREFQFFLKYWVASTVMLLVIMIVSDLVPEVRMPNCTG